MEIGVADLRSADTRELLAEHQRRMLGASPPGTSFALDLSGLECPEVTVFEVRSGGSLMGVAALKALADGRGEIKSMRTADAALRRGVGQALLDHLVSEARQRGYSDLLLETGTGPAFEAANSLYRRSGFVRRGPFGDYAETAFNIFYERPVGQAAG